jgi:hypothetical protein
VVDVEQRPLRAFEQHGGSVPHPPVEEQCRVGDVRPEPRDGSLDGLHDVVHLEALAATALQEPVLDGKGRRELLPEVGLVEKVADADAEAGRLVGVGLPHALARGPDPLLIHRLVERPVVRQDHVGGIRDVEAVDADAGGREAVQLLDERDRIHHGAAADDALLAGAEDPRRDQLENEAPVAEHDGVPGIRAPGVSRHHVHAGGDQVDDLPLPLVAPLGAHDHDVRQGLLRERAREHGSGPPSARREGT